MNRLDPEHDNLPAALTHARGALDAGAASDMGREGRLTKMASPVLAGRIAAQLPH
jgi:hypothetical protein